MELSLPSVSTKLTPRYPLVPRRYEETRPVVVQDFTHRRILGFGNEIHRKQIEQIELEKLAAIRKAEEAVWQQAEQIKDSAVESVKKQAKLDQEKIVRKMLKEMDRKLKEEGLKVEMAMQKLALEQVKEERVKGETSLKDAVRQSEKKCESDKLKAVAAVQTEERRIAKAAVTRLNRIHEEEMAKLKAEMVLEHKNEIEALGKQKDQERGQAVKKTREQEQKMASDSLKVVQSQNDKQLQDLNAQIDSKLKVISELQKQIENILKSKKKVEDRLVETQQAFLRSIIQIGGLSEDQANFLMPSLYLDELEES